MPLDESAEAQQLASLHSQRDQLVSQVDTLQLRVAGLKRDLEYYRA
jgi:hypothetical protein